MEIFLDTANIEEIRKGVDWGIVDGVTTNPTLVSKENAIFEERIKEICEVVQGPVSAEVVSTKYEGMVKEAEALAKLSEFVVVKIPLIPDGIKAIKTLSKKGIQTNATLVFSPLQALLAAKAGATYVSPFIGRMDDIGNTGMTIVGEIMEIFDNYGYNTKVIVASVRHPQHVLEAGLIGAHVVTMPFDVLEKMFKHPMTDIGLERFLQDWKKYQDYMANKK
ncbi:fructose-6-phosphate aldolase [Petrotoga sp. 9PWA.NaAc.5.4]|uniref:fructose-6-phosphate aldolase n=1 Tax=Petrotoga sp. 9PWA.NaAc.5.4 TaxID=1434328 RepID=UPI000CB7E3A6|nr:fructose-6-phosphate aldolase [Petrotoga sp. 9PWA.NaAc.5.4]PNR96613.1 transaldolase [Petrotoga sp. 9PWA.NaAc.5.4]